MNRIEELKAAIDAFARPKLSFASIGSTHGSLAAARAWDVEHPVEAAARAKLCAELAAEEKRVERAELEAKATERALRTMGAKLARSGIGERSLATAAEAEDTEALSLVKRWLAKRGESWLVICGPKGVGKSVAATWAVREVIRNGDTAAFRRAGELAKLSQFDAGAAELEYLKGVALLVVDDFGTELLTDYARAQFFELLDARHEAYGRTVITSNLHWLPRDDKPGLEQRLGDRLVDRIRQAGTVQLLGGPSRRRKSEAA